MFDLETSTHANYIGAHIDVHEAPIFARFPDATLELTWAGSLTRFSTVEGDDVSV